MGSHAPPPTQPLTCHVNDVLGYGTFRLTKYRRFGQNVFNMFTESDIIGRGVTE